MTLIILWIVNKIIPIRLSAIEETLGCDKIEHFDDEQQFVDDNAPVTKIDTKFICPCHLAHNNDLNKRKVFYDNQNFEP